MPCGEHLPVDPSVHTSQPEVKLKNKQSAGRQASHTKLGQQGQQQEHGGTGILSRMHNKQKLSQCNGQKRKSVAPGWSHEKF